MFSNNKSIIFFLILSFSFSFLLYSDSLTAAETPPIDVVDVIGGDGYTIILESNGDVWSWGRNDYAQLGLGDKIDRYSPEKINSSRFDSKVIEITTSRSVTTARTESGSIYYWGSSTTNPTKIHSSNEIVQTSVTVENVAGSHVSFHLVNTLGEVMNSGSSYTGAFGQGLSGYGSSGLCTTTYNTSSSDFSRLTLTSVDLQICPSNDSFNFINSGIPLTGVSKLATRLSGHSTVGLTKNNLLYRWGSGTMLATPMNVPENLTIKKVVYGNEIWFITDDDRIFKYESLSALPVEIFIGEPEQQIVDIEASNSHLLFLMNDGSVYATGENKNGQLGPNISLNGISSIEDTGLRNIKSIGVGLTHSIVVTIDNEIKILGTNNFGELASSNPNLKQSFTLNTLVGNVKDIHTTGHTSYAVTTDEKFWVWGEGATNFRPGALNIPIVAKDFSSISPVKKITGNSAIGSYHGNVVLENGEVQTFGGSWQKGIGRGGATYTLNTLVDTQDRLAVDETFMIDGSQGAYHGVSLNDKGHLFSWGYDVNYSLGQGFLSTVMQNGSLSTTGENAFSRVVMPTGVTFKSVYANENYGKYAISTDNDVYVWGQNSSNSLGMIGSPRVPTKLTTIPTKIKSIATGYNYALFLDTEGDIWSVGSNTYGNLGLGNTSSSSTPTKINALDNIHINSIYADAATSFAISDTGVVYGWGDNRYGQLGLGDFIQRNEPRPLTDFEGRNVINVAPSDKHSMLLVDTGDLYVTGSDGYGQLGLQQSSINETPTIVIFPPVVAINSANNQSFSVNDSLNVSGNIQNKNENINVSLDYRITDINGEFKNGNVKSFTTMTEPENYDFNLNFSDFPLGNYTLIVRATTETGVEGENYINFKIEDTIKPTISSTFSPNTNGSWKTENVYFDVIADDIGGSGFSNFKYALTATATKPSIWDATYLEKNKRVTVERSGIFYLHLEAFDADGNSQYVSSGPFYVDQKAPIINFTEPAKWQQENLSLNVNFQDVSAIVEKKWIKGSSSISNIKTNGTVLNSTSVPISENGVYSFYARDENGQESLISHTVQNINKKPTLNNVESPFIIPYLTKNNASFQLNFSHTENTDAVQLRINENNLSSTNSITGIKSFSDEIFRMNLSSLIENTIHTKNLSLTDSRSGTSNSVSSQFEVYNPKIKTIDTLGKITIKWEHSKLNQQYKLFRDGLEIATTQNNTITDTLIQKGEQYTYTLFIENNGSYLEVDSTKKSYHSFNFITPNSIFFPTISLGDTESHKATSIDVPYLEYEDLTDEKSPYTLRVTMDDFSSNTDSFSPQKAEITSVPIKNKAGETIDELNNVPLSPFGSDLFHMDVNDILLNPFIRLDLEASAFELSIPDNIHTNGNSTENFSSDITWEILRTP